MKYLKIIIPFILSVVLILCILFYTDKLSKTEENLGIQALLALYEFDTVDRLEDNLKKFRHYVSEDVFQQMTIDNSDRVLGVYLKLKGNPCVVDIVESTPNYIIYRLISDSIEEQRLFLFCYEIKNNKIVEIKEAEIFSFPTTHVWDMK